MDQPIDKKSIYSDPICLLANLLFFFNCKSDKSLEQPLEMTVGEIPINIENRSKRQKMDDGYQERKESKENNIVNRMLKVEDKLYKLNNNLHELLDRLGHSDRVKEQSINDAKRFEFARLTRSHAKTNSN